jgi:tetratricopeptide (TPR) repeat protein
MANFSSLLDKLPSINQSKMIYTGFGVWLTWTGPANSAVAQTLADYGGLCLAQETNQSLWFFFSQEVFRPIARLQVWARLNPMPVCCELIQATLLVDYHLHLSLSVPSEIRNQDLSPADEFEVWVHPNLKDLVHGVHGLGVREAKILPGMANANWMLLTVDQGLDYETGLGWFMAMKPLGNPADKAFISGWRAVFQEIQIVLQRLEIKYLSKDNFVIFSIDGLRLLRTFCKDILRLLKELRNSEEKEYWPVVMAAISKQGHNFNEDLPSKFNLDWTKLAPDFPHLQYKTAFLLGEGFRINEIQYGPRDETIDSWCNVGLIAGQDEVETTGSLQVHIPRNLVVGGYSECFYCGLRNHPPALCPSRQLPKWNPNIWNKLARISIDDIDKGFIALEEGLDKDNLLNSLSEVLLGEQKKTQSLLLQAMFEINAVEQLRMLKLVWRSRGKDWPVGISQIVADQSEYLHVALDHMYAKQYEEADTLLKQSALKLARSYQPRSLRGYLSLETEDHQQALFFWQEAERLAYTPLQQAFFYMLAGRVLETDGELRDAVHYYKQAQSTSPRWLEPIYREAACMVKMGFTEQALSMFTDLIQRDPNMFNRILIDHELDRGRIHLMGALWSVWTEAETMAEEQKKRLDKLANDVGQWFDAQNEFHEQSHAYVDRLAELTEVRNYVAFIQLARGCDTLQQQIDERVEKEIKIINMKLEMYFERLKDIQKEAAWFPFPRLLLEFNRDFNFCAEKLNWIKSAHLKVAENFRNTQKYLSEIDEHLLMLQRRLVSLRIIRDSTLFVLMLGKNFMWMELASLGLALVTVPAFIYFTRGLQGNWLVDLVVNQKWDFQKGLVLILSILAMTIAALRTAISFERKKNELFEQKEEELAAKRAERKNKKKKTAPAKSKK